MYRLCPGLRCARKALSGNESNRRKQRKRSPGCGAPVILPVRPAYDRIDVVHGFSVPRVVFRTRLSAIRNWSTRHSYLRSLLFIGFAMDGKTGWRETSAPARSQMNPAAARFGSPAICPREFASRRTSGKQTSGRRRRRTRRCRSSNLGLSSSRRSRRRANRRAW